MIVPTEVVDAARGLDKLYVPTRYPNGFDQGKPGDYFTDKDASRAIEQATTVLDLSERHLARP
jgi:HEPN domain-containing protein